MKFPKFLPHFSLTSSKLQAYVALYFTLILNYAFYRAILTAHPFTGASYDYFLLTIPLFIFFTLNAVYQLLALPYLHKIIMPLLLITSAAIGYNTLFYNVYFDTNMLENVLQTTSTEAGKLITLPYLLWIAVFGVLPALLYLGVKVRYRTWHKEIALRALMILLSLVVIAGIAKVYYQDYAFFVRNNKQTVNLIVPSNFIGAGVNEVKRVRQANRPFERIGLDAKQVKADGQRRRVLVLVPGETTRAQNWGLNGYQRQTTPKLAARGTAVVNFPNVSSCGTATALSLPCMFSVMDRDHYNGSVAQKQDSVLDLIQRSGANVLWLDNDSGCKYVCDRVPNENVSALQLPEFCRNGECLDNILLYNFERQISADPSKDLVIALHTMGNHGPTYSERYSEEYHRFIPSCDTQDIAKCSQEQLVNSYDNGVLYIDQFLDRIIAKLQQHSEWNTALYYVSDHGESLGESGMYLHGAPYSIAPKEQTRVPMIFWASDGWKQQTGLNTQCLQQQADSNAYSHDNYFHSVLGLMEIKTEVYQAQQDLFAACR
ncbi:phosphoethanolamine transferase [Testudinibacter sp. P80/BLE/0925]|uniref:phosphoethanolamine transferase n=1 Tax=Testudinibacter sp. TW-1 TaxID=3417757 RepID=UPI003D36DAF6